MTAELAEVRDFLAAHAPFDALPAEVLARVPAQCTLRYARRGTVVLDAGEPGEGLYVVRSGAVDVVDEAGGLVERVGTGGAFGMSSLLEHRPTRYRCTATEDTLLLVLPAELFATLSREHTAVATFFAATHHARLARAIGNLQQAASGSTVLSTLVRDLVTRGPVTTAPGSSIAEAAAEMARASVSCILVVDDAEGGLAGIVTDRDLRNRVLAAGLDPARPVRDVMTSPALTLREGALAFEALLEMVTREIHHLPVVDAHGVPVGLVTTTDLVRLENSNPVYLAADVGRQTTLVGVVEQARRIPTVLGELVDRDLSAADIGRVVTALGDAVRRRVIALVEAEVAARRGPAPTGWSWVVLGSVAREEEALGSDQDHALVLAEPGHDAWFAELADGVTDALEECGWPRCPGDMVATNPAWRLTVDGWNRQFQAWSHRLEPEAVLDTAIFHDMRHLAGDPHLTDRVREAALASVTPLLVGHLSGQALRMRAPLGFFRGFVLEHEGEHRDTLDIKRPIITVVQLGRVHAMRAGSPALTTRARLAAAAEGGVISRELATDLADALELMSYRRLHHQVERVRAGGRPDNHLAPADLTDRQRRHLKDAFAIVRRAQQHLADRLDPGFT
jgi:CBS domain-containing protein